MLQYLLATNSSTLYVSFCKAVAVEESSSSLVSLSRSICPRPTSTISAISEYLQTCVFPTRCNSIGNLSKWLTGAPQGHLQRSKIHLVAIVEDYMSLRREESAVFQEFDQMRISKPMQIKQYSQVCIILITAFPLLREHTLSALHQMTMAKHAELGSARCYGRRSAGEGKKD